MKIGATTAHKSNGVRPCSSTANCKPCSVRCTGAKSRKVYHSRRIISKDALDFFQGQFSDSIMQRCSLTCDPAAHDWDACRIPYCMQGGGACMGPAGRGRRVMQPNPSAPGCSICVFFSSASSTGASIFDANETKSPLSYWIIISLSLVSVMDGHWLEVCEDTD